MIVNKHGKSGTILSERNISQMINEGPTEFIMVNDFVLNLKFKLISFQYGGCLGIVQFDSNMDFNEYIEGEPNTLFLGFYDGKIILNKNEDEDAY